MDGGRERGEVDRLREVDLEPGRLASLHVLLHAVARERDALMVGWLVVDERGEQPTLTETRVAVVGSWGGCAAKGYLETIVLSEHFHQLEAGAVWQTDVADHQIELALLPLRHLFTLHKTPALMSAYGTQHDTTHRTRHDTRAGGRRRTSRASLTVEATKTW